MDIKYRILSVDDLNHSLGVRFYTDNITEDELANELNPDNSIKRTEDGYPTRCRSDVYLTIYDTPSPTGESLEKYIMRHVPIAAFQLHEAIKNPDVDTSLSHAKSLIGKEISVTKQIDK